MAPSTNTTPSMTSPSGAVTVPKISDSDVGVVKAGQLTSAKIAVRASTTKRNRVRKRIVGLLATFLPASSKPRARERRLPPTRIGLHEDDFDAPCPPCPCAPRHAL